jgi:hypothetical protein
MAPSTADHPFIGSYAFSWCRVCGQAISQHRTRYVGAAAGEPDVIPVDTVD